MSKIIISSIDELRELRRGNELDIDLHMPHGIKHSEEARVMIAGLLEENRLRGIDYGSELLPGAKEVEPNMVHAIIDALMEKIGANDSLERLNIDFHGEDLGSEKLKFFAHVSVENRSIRECRLSGFSCSYMDLEGLEALNALRSNPVFQVANYFIRELNLHNARADLGNLIAVKEMLESGVPIVRLDLSGNGIDSNLAKGFELAMRGSEVLEELNLADNDIGAEFLAAMIGDWLRHNSLHKLNIANNNIAGAAANKSLFQISFSLPLFELNYSGNDLLGEEVFRNQVINVGHCLATNYFIHEHFPYLAGVYREYLRHAIRDFLTGKTEEERGLEIARLRSLEV